jgi:hypothetical protein
MLSYFTIQLCVYITVVSRYKRVHLRTMRDTARGSIGVKLGTHKITRFSKLDPFQDVQWQFTHH